MDRGALATMAWRDAVSWLDLESGKRLLHRLYIRKLVGRVSSQKRGERQQDAGSQAVKMTAVPQDIEKLLGRDTL